MTEKVDLTGAVFEDVGSLKIEESDLETRVAVLEGQVLSLSARVVISPEVAQFLEETYEREQTKKSILARVKQIVVATWNKAPVKTVITAAIIGTASANARDTLGLLGNVIRKLLAH